MTGDGAGVLEFEIFTLFPEAVSGFLRAGLIGKALESGRVAIHCTNFRDFTTDRHRTVDDTPYGGGPGMVIKIEPVLAALDAVTRERGSMHRVLLTPSAPVFDQQRAQRLATRRRIALICGRYEGIDDRLREAHVDESLSIGDFVLNGGEVAALAIVEAVARLHEGVIGNPESLARESFAADVFEGAADTGRWLEPPQYTRPVAFRDQRVPDVLLRGNHAEIERWRREQSWSRTWSVRPELRRGRASKASRRPLYIALTGDSSKLTPELRLLLTKRIQQEPRLSGLLLLGDAACAGWGDGQAVVSRVRNRRALRRLMRQRHGQAPKMLGIAAQSPGDSVLSTSDPEALEDFLRLDEHERAESPLILLLRAPEPSDSGDPSWPAVDINFQAGPGARPEILADLTASGVARSPVIDESSQPPFDPGALVELVFATLSSILADPESAPPDSRALP